MRLEGLFMEPFIAAQSVSTAIKAASVFALPANFHHKRMDKFLIASFCVNIRQSSEFSLFLP